MSAIGRNHRASAEQAVRARVAAAESRRRAREASRRLWQAAPLVAAAGLLVATLGRWAAWPARVSVVVMALGGVGLLTYFLVCRRRRTISDAAASAIDRDAGMDGELRSATWFATRATRDEWADFHVARAAERLEASDWTRLYPPVRAPRARIATALLTLAAVAVILTAPEPRLAPSTALAAPFVRTLSSDAPRHPELLPPELQRQLEALLAAAEAGDLSLVQKLTTNAELRNMLNRLAHLRDPELLQALARQMAAEVETDGQSGTEAMDRLADRARLAAESAALSDGMREVLEKLADELELASPAVRASDADVGATPSDEPAPGGGGAAGQPEGMPEVTMQLAQASESDEGAGVILMSGQDTQEGAGAPGAGVGGSGSDESRGTGTATEIEAALRQEVVEASNEQPGSSEETEVRRKTGQSDATASFTRSTTRAFDQTRATAPPAVPETRRSGVQNYFVRKAQ